MNERLSLDSSSIHPPPVWTEVLKASQRPAQTITAAKQMRRLQQSIAQTSSITAVMDRLKLWPFRREDGRNAYEVLHRKL